MAEILARYEHKEGSEIRQLPVSVSDVDEIYIWLTVHPDAFTGWHVAVPWSRIVADYLPARVAELLASEDEPADVEVEVSLLGDGAAGSTAACDAADGGFESSPDQPEEAA